jgi:hypothetical protein
MKRNKYHRKPVFHKIKHSSNTKLKKEVAKRTREYMELRDPNREREDDNMSRNMISSVAVSRLNAVAANRTDILAKQKEASVALQHLNTEYNDLQKEWNKRDRQIKEDDKIKAKLEDIKEKRREQERIIKGYTIRKKELDTLMDYMHLL